VFILFFGSSFSCDLLQELLAHAQKRQIEVKCIEMQDTMEAQGYNEKEIEEQVNSMYLLLSFAYILLSMSHYPS
jgi:hypothetical protein